MEAVLRRWRSACGTFQYTAIPAQIWFYRQLRDDPIFRQISVFIIGFSITDMPVFEVLWANDELRKVFMEKQIQKTLWPIFRQHAHDGMSRLGMAPVSLPWLM